MRTIDHIDPDSWHKTIAGVILGFTLALAMSGIFAAWAGAGVIGSDIHAQLMMWVLAPISTLVFSSVVLLGNGRQALVGLVFANVFAYLVLSALKASSSLM